MHVFTISLAMIDGFFQGTQLERVSICSAAVALVVSAGVVGGVFEVGALIKRRRPIARVARLLVFWFQRPHSSCGGNGR